MDLLATIERGSQGEPLGNPQFAVASVGFNALVAWNAMELATIGADDFSKPVAELVESIESLWDPDLSTWVDGGIAAAGSGSARTADALLPLLVSTDSSHRGAASNSLIDPSAHGSAHGPLGVHRAEPSFEADTYWRGPVWPQLAYLLWRALTRGGSSSERECAGELVRSTIKGAEASGLAEYWNGDSGEGLGAVPQTWTGLALLMGR